MRTWRHQVAAAVVLMAAALPLAAEDVALHQVTFPERKKVDVQFSTTSSGPRAEMKAKVEYREGQAEISVRYQDMKPAILFGGDVTSYVLWAVARDGTVENVGELWVVDASERIDFSVGLKSFAMLVTAESYPRVDVPSELVVFVAGPPDGKRVPSEPFTFSDFRPAPEHERSSIAAVSWTRRQPIYVAQAEKIFDMAEREGAEEETPGIHRDARVALAQAQNISAHSSDEKAAVDYARRSVALSSEAIQMIRRRREAEELARQIAQRKAEMEALEARAREAEDTAARARQAMESAREEQTEAEQRAEEARQALETVRKEREAAEQAISLAQAELSRMEQEKRILEEQQAQLQAEKQELMEEKASLQDAVSEMAERAERLRQEREELADRLQGALSKVADTTASARGMIVNLPDILFEVDEANLKNDARVVLAKLAGILLIMPELNLRIEGHTDATGPDEYNQRLSERRAAAVRDFLAAQGVDMNRMVAVGYGESRPVADNDTREGRQKNRRVEIVIAEGEVAEAP